MCTHTRSASNSNALSFNARFSASSSLSSVGFCPLLADNWLDDAVSFVGCFGSDFLAAGYDGQ
jgi:hypothetical protein